MNIKLHFTILNHITLSYNYIYTYFSIPKLAVLVVVIVQPREMLHHQIHPPLALLLIKLYLNIPDCFNWYSTLVVDQNNNHSKESSEIQYLQFNQVLKVYI